MTNYALVDDNDNILRHEKFTEVPLDPQGKPWRWLPVVDTKPAFDPATEVREGPVITVNANDVTRVWTVRSKTAQELDDEKEAEYSGGLNGNPVLRAVVLALNDGTLVPGANETNANIKAAIKAKM
jgi:hypothetical protein